MYTYNRRIIIHILELFHDRMIEIIMNKILMNLCSTRECFLRTRIK